MLSGIIITEQNIYEYVVEPAAIGSKRYVVWYTKSGQPAMCVIEGSLSKNQAEDADFVKSLILKQEEG